MSLFLPFLPLLPKQILLINLLTDFPEMTIAGDNVDDELVQRPRRWDIRFIRRFMIVFGTLSSVFRRYLTFAYLMWLGATMTQFRTGWFIRSIVSAALIVLACGAEPAIFKSRRGQLLALATAATICGDFSCTASAIQHHGLVSSRCATRLSPIIVLIVIAYMAAAEVTKHLFLHRASRSSRINLANSSNRWND